MPSVLFYRAMPGIGTRMSITHLLHPGGVCGVGKRTAPIFGLENDDPLRREHQVIDLNQPASLSS